MIKKYAKKMYRIAKKLLRCIKMFFYGRAYPNKYFFHTKRSRNWANQYAVYRNSETIESNWVFYESHAGIGMVCNPYAIFKAFQTMLEFKDYLHIWAVTDKKERRLLEKEYKDVKNVKFVYYGSEGYAYFVAKSKYLINNTSFSSAFSKREEQVFLNTWHSVTVKSLGYDTPDAPRVINNMLRNMLMADYIVSPNRFMTDIFDNSFRLRDIYNGKYIEEGYPRNDLLLNTPREYIFKKLEQRGTRVDRKKKIILYAPTWTGNSSRNPAIDMSKYSELSTYLANNIDTNEYQLLIKPHPVVYRRLSKQEKESGRYVAYTIDANELLSVVDVLITDYSSIYFDYLMKEMPILFYLPDYEDYQKMRGIYFKPEELPGACCYDLHTLADCINNLEKTEFETKSKRDATKLWACEFDNGKVSDKILDIIFKGNENYNIKGAKKTGKKTIWMYIGNLATNGVTSAALSLLNNIDYNQFDVSVFVLKLTNDEENTNFDKIPPQVRVILRHGAPKLNPRDKKIYEKMLRNGFPQEEAEQGELERVMRSEYTRCFGNATFDYLIDFSGTSPLFFAIVYGSVASGRSKFFIWQHNDMYKDITNVVKQQLNRTKATLEALLSCYQRANRIVSATESVYRINKKNLATPTTETKFTYVTNLMDTSRIRSMLQEDGVFCDETGVSFEGNRAHFPINKHQIKFCTMGRYMPEKNHDNLIRAVKRLNDEGYNAALYIIGDGHLRENLEKLRKELNLEDKVFLTGVLQNPLALMKRCDCFIFPSIYEAQGLSVLEARCIGLPIIVSNYEAVDSVLLDDKQYVLNGTDVDSIYEGMLAYIHGKVPADYVFDLDGYNKKGLSEFYRLLDT